MNPSSKKIGNWNNIKEVLFKLAGETSPHSFPDKLNFHWNLIVGCQLAAVSKVDRLSSRTLYIRVANEEWVPALKGLEKKIINEFDSRTTPNLVNRLAFREHKNNFCETVGKSKQVSKNKHFPIPPSAEHNRPMKKIKDDGLRDVLRRLERKFCFFPLMVGMVLVGFVSNCTTDPNYRTEKSHSSRTYVVEKTLPDPASVQVVSSSKGRIKRVSEEDLYQAAEDRRIATKRIRERNEKYLKKVLELHKAKPSSKYKDPEAYYNYLMALKAERRGDFDAAVNRYRLVLDHDPATEKFYMKLVDLYQSDGQLDQAKVVCRSGLERFPKNTGLRLALAEILSTHGEDQEALSHLEKIFNDTHNIKALLLSGIIQSKNKNYTQAEKVFTKTVLLDPGNPLGHHYLGRNYALNKQYPEAEKSLRKSLTLRPSLTNTRILLAWIMENLGKYQLAEDEYKILRKIEPENPEIQEKLAQLSRTHSNEHPDQTPIGNAGPFPEDSSLPLKFGMIYFEQSQYLRALKEFRLYLAKKESAEVRLLIAKIYELFKNYPKAINELEILQKQDPQSVEVLLQIARMYHLDDNTDRAVNVLQKAANLQPDNDQIYHSLSLAYLSKNQQQKAIEFIRRALEINNNQATYYFELGALLEQVDQVDEAIESMREVLRIDPRHSNAHNFIGYLYALQGEKLDKAIDHLEKALAVQPQNGYFLDSLGWIYFRQGNPAQALVEIKKAMIYTSPDPVIYDHLGDIHFDLKNYKEAGKAWKISLSLTNRKKEEALPETELPDVNVLEEKLQKLDNLLKQSF